MTRTIRLVLLSMALAGVPALVACGGGSAEAAHEVPEAPLVPVEEEPGGGIAAEGDDCDFGGAERLTCRGGLVCCYPPEGEVAYGTCRSDCPGYD